MAKEQKYEMKPSNGKVLELQFEGRMTKQHLEFMEEAAKKYKNKKDNDESGCQYCHLVPE